MKKVLVLYFDVAGGHFASSKAIAKAITYRYENTVTVKLVDVGKSLSFVSAQQIDEAYRWLTSDGVWMWKALWKTDEMTWVPSVLSRLLKPLLSQTLIHIFSSEKPDLVISVHPLLNHIPLMILREDLKSTVPILTVVTDLVTAHPFWFYSEIDYCMVPTERARERALRYGMPEDHIEVIGQPVDIDFASRLGKKQDCRRLLDLEEDRPCVLIMGGGDGMGPVYRIAQAIEARAPNVQMIIVAGRNPELKAKLEERAWQIPAKIYGFTENMPELMKASDVIVTKGGPGSIAEAIVAGVPMIISHYIPGQEIGNVEYALEHEVGVYIEDPSEIADTVRTWLETNSATYDQMVQNAVRIARPNAALDIAERVYQFLYHQELS